MGAACSEYRDGAFQNLSTTHVEVDEIWSCVYAELDTVRQAADEIAHEHHAVPAAPLADQPTSDGHRVYLIAVDAAFGADVDYAMLQKPPLNASGPSGR